MNSNAQTHPEKDCSWTYDELKTHFAYPSAPIETLTLKIPKYWQGTSWTKLFEDGKTNETTLSTGFLKTWKEKLKNLQNLEMDLPILRKSNQSLEKLVLPLSLLLRGILFMVQFSTFWSR